MTSETTQRGRKTRSVANLKVVALPPPKRRVTPAPYLSREQKKIWRQVVSCMPNDWFDHTTTELLAAFCMHAHEVRRINSMIEGALGNDVSTTEYITLLGARERAIRGVAMTATKLRMTPKAVLNHRGNRVPEIKKAGWTPGT